VAPGSFTPSEINRRCCGRARSPNRTLLPSSDSNQFTQSHWPGSARFQAIGGVPSRRIGVEHEPNPSNSPIGFRGERQTKARPRKPPLERRMGRLPRCPAGTFPYPSELPRGHYRAGFGLARQADPLGIVSGGFPPLKTIDQWELQTRFLMPWKQFSNI
jgi:hypothetical protein